MRGHGEGNQPRIRPSVALAEVMLEHRDVDDIGPTCSGGNNPAITEFLLGASQ